MRIPDNKSLAKKIFFSRTSSVFYLFLFCFLVYKIFLVYPLWHSAKVNFEVGKQVYEERLQKAKNEKENLENKQTDLGKERYQKDFYNKLDEGEELIILYSAKKEEEFKKDEKKLVLMFWEEWIQDIKVWWRNR